MGFVKEPGAAETTLEDQIRALGPWFHNLRINGIETAPDHFLGDYPEIKFAAFRDAILHFVEHRYAHDETNWWVPNRACVEAMLRSSGFSIESHPEDEVYLCRWRPVEDPPDGPHCFLTGAPFG